MAQRNQELVLLWKQIEGATALVVCLSSGRDVEIVFFRRQGVADNEGLLVLIDHKENFQAKFVIEPSLLSENLGVSMFGFRLLFHQRSSSEDAENRHTHVKTAGLSRAGKPSRFFGGLNAFPTLLNHWRAAAPVPIEPYCTSNSFADILSGGRHYSSAPAPRHIVFVDGGGASYSTIEVNDRPLKAVE
jgi:hypothetical protein